MGFDIWATHISVWWAPCWSGFSCQSKLQVHCACHKQLSCASGRHRFLQLPHTALREEKNSISKEKTPNFCYTFFFFLSMKDIYEGIIIFIPVSPLHTVRLYYTYPDKDLLCFLNRLLLRDFCNSFLFSWDSICSSKRSIAIQFKKKNLAS